MTDVIRKFAKFNLKDKGSKVPEYWIKPIDFVNEGVTFYVKFLGSTLVEEIRPDSNETYDDGKCERAIGGIVSMAKSGLHLYKKLHKIALRISTDGVKMQNLTTGETQLDMAIHRIRFCCTSKIHHKVFSMIFRNDDNETMECLAFLCAKEKMAQALTLTVAQSFEEAKKLAKSKKRPLPQPLNSTVSSDEKRPTTASHQQLDKLEEEAIRFSQKFITRSENSTPVKKRPDASTELSPSTESVSRKENELWMTFDDNNAVDSAERRSFSTAGFPSLSPPPSHPKFSLNTVDNVTNANIKTSTSDSHQVHQKGTMNESQSSSSQIVSLNVPSFSSKTVTTADGSNDNTYKIDSNGMDNDFSQLASMNRNVIQSDETFHQKTSDDVAWRADFNDVVSGPTASKSFNDLLRLQIPTSVSFSSTSTTQQSSSSVVNNRDGGSGLSSSMSNPFATDAFSLKQRTTQQQTQPLNYHPMILSQNLEQSSVLVNDNAISFNNNSSTMGLHRSSIDNYGSNPFSSSVANDTDPPSSNHFPFKSSDEDQFSKESFSQNTASLEESFDGHGPNYNRSCFDAALLSKGSVFDASQGDSRAVATDAGSFAEPVEARVGSDRPPVERVPSFLNDRDVWNYVNNPEKRWDDFKRQNSVDDLHKL